MLAEEPGKPGESDTYLQNLALFLFVLISAMHGPQQIKQAGTISSKAARVCQSSLYFTISVDLLDTTIIANTHQDTEEYNTRARYSRANCFFSASERMILVLVSNKTILSSFSPVLQSDLPTRNLDYC